MQLLKPSKHQTYDTVESSALCIDNVCLAVHVICCVYAPVRAQGYVDVRGPGISFWVAALAPVVVGLTRVKPSLFETGLTPPARMWTRCVRAADILVVLSRLEE